MLMPDPYYATYEGVIAASGAKFVPIRTDPEDGFHLTRKGTARSKMTPKSRALLLNTPNNPTGAVLHRRRDRRDRRRSAASMICGSSAMRSMPTLTYGIVFASPFDNPGLRERTVVVSSLSKSHAMPGFRCGWAGARRTSPIGSCPWPKPCCSARSPSSRMRPPSRSPIISRKSTR